MHHGDHLLHNPESSPGECHCVGRRREWNWEQWGFTGEGKEEQLAPTREGSHILNRRVGGAAVMQSTGHPQSHM